MNVEAVSALKITRKVRATRQAVWDAWTQPEQMMVWSCPAPGGMSEATADLRVGGEFTMQMVVEGQEHNAFGTYREIDEPRRLVYTWDWREEEYRMGETLVTVELNEVEDGTEIVLVHEGFPAAEARDGHETGWVACLDLLVAHVDD